MMENGHWYSNNNETSIEQTNKGNYNSANGFFTALISLSMWSEKERD